MLSYDAGLEAKRGIPPPTVNLKDLSTQRVGVDIIADFGGEAKEMGDSGISHYTRTRTDPRYKM